MLMRSNAIQRCISDGIAILMLIEIEMQHIMAYTHKFMLIAFYTRYTSL